MLDEPVAMCTRARLKSCLKITPPITPELSAAPSPCGSGRTSPSMVSDSGSSSSGGRKTVSFCSDAELEEVFFVDEWDRTPAAVTPKLTYQDVLELKQLRVNLPYTPPPPPPRQPFTTSAPSSSKPPFPVSRFASTASHTPSKWKNRSAPHRADVDPEILPYLDAVPIRLLPLLPQSPTEPDPPPSAPPEPHPQTPTPTASPETRPTVRSRDPPELRIEPVIPPPVSPPSPPTPSQLRRQNFAFLPLLPVQDPPPIPPPPTTSHAPVRPRRKFNMTFVPVNAAPESDPSSSTEDVSAPKQADVDGEAGLSTSAPSPSPSSSVSRANQSPGAGYFTDAHLTSLTSYATSSIDSSSSSHTSPPPMLLSLPILSAFQRAIESDTETETDTYTDTDAESDAPSTSTRGSSLPSSPPCNDDNVIEEDLCHLKLDTELVPPGFYPRIHRDSDGGSYFPPVDAYDAAIAVHLPSEVVVADASPTHSSKPGQTPPLSVLFPSPRSQAQALLPLDTLARALEPAGSGSCKELETPVVPTSFQSDAIPPPSPTLPALVPPSPSALANMLAGELSVPSTPLSLSRALRKKLMLEALPSPALVPPSPFELEPLPEHKDRGAGGVRIVERTPVVTPEDSPLLTLESVRAAWDARARASLAPTFAARPNAGVIIGPSLSRRRSLS